MKRKNGLTLIEILVVLGIFGLVMSAAGGALYGIFSDWKKQNDYITCIDNARWAIEFMSNGVRQSDDDDVNVQSESVGPDTVNRLRFIRSGTGNPWIRYFLGNDGAFGSVNALNRKEGGLGPPNQRQTLANFIVGNPDLADNTTGALGYDGLADPVFIYSSNLLTITLTVRPRPAEANALSGNKDYTLRTRVRPRVP